MRSFKIVVFEKSGVLRKSAKGIEGRSDSRSVACRNLLKR
jgi:hypothetical protein